MGKGFIQPLSSLCHLMSLSIPSISCPCPSPLVSHTAHLHAFSPRHQCPLESCSFSFTLPPIHPHPARHPFTRCSVYHFDPCLWKIPGLCWLSSSVPICTLAGRHSALWRVQPDPQSHFPLVTHVSEAPSQQNLEAASFQFAFLRLHQ